MHPPLNPTTTPMSGPGSDEVTPAAPDDLSTDFTPPPAGAFATVKVPIFLHPEPGGYSVEAPSLPGCWSQGDSAEEAIANIAEAAEGWLMVRHDQFVAARRDG